MSISDRMFRLSKAYVNQVRDQIDTGLSDHERALAELDESRGGRDTRSRDLDTSTLMRRAAEAEADLDRSMKLATGRTGGTNVMPTSRTVETTDPNARDYQVLGVEVGSDLGTVQAAYENLASRCDPSRFAEGSAEQREAAQNILDRVNASYDVLRKRLDPTQNRFGKLELE